VTGLRSKLQQRWRKSVDEGATANASPSSVGADALEKAFQQEEANLTEWENRFSRLSELIKLTRADIAAKRNHLGLGEKMDAAAASLATQAHNFWNTEIFTLNDSVFR
jgi:hypothetical protein